MRIALADFVVELTKPRLRAAIINLRRRVLSRAAAKLPTALLDDARIAATEELARRGLHVITHRPDRSRHQARAQRKLWRH